MALAQIEATQVPHGASSKRSNPKRFLNLICMPPERVFFEVAKSRSLEAGYLKISFCLGLERRIQVKSTSLKLLFGNARVSGDFDKPRSILHIYLVLYYKHSPNAVNWNINGWKLLFREL
jgi:hypothetical protein